MLYSPFFAAGAVIAALGLGAMLLVFLLGLEGMDDDDEHDHDPY